MWDFKLCWGYIYVRGNLGRKSRSVALDLHLCYHVVARSVIPEELRVGRGGQGSPPLPIHNPGL